MKQIVKQTDTYIGFEGSTRIFECGNCEYKDIAQKFTGMDGYGTYTSVQCPKCKSSLAYEYVSGSSS